MLFLLLSAYESSKTLAALGQSVDCFYLFALVVTTPRQELLYHTWDIDHHLAQAQTLDLGIVILEFEQMTRTEKG
jgi:hypothetical protein